jgi:glycosyltransferase involved in cell wall biosynthesis
MSIALILPTYNSEEFLAHTLRSITAQERRPDEVLVVDDGSKDDTLTIVEAWAQEQTFRVRLLKNRYPHQGEHSRGPAGGRMTGLLEVQTDMVGLIDHDDVMLPNHLRVTEQALLRHPNMELCFGDALEFDRTHRKQWSLFEGKAIERVLYHEERPSNLRIIAEPLLPSLLIGSYIPTAANLWRRETALQIGGFSRSAGTCDDLLFFLKLSRCGSVGYYPFPIARKRVHDMNLSNVKYSLQHCWNLLYALQQLAEEDDSWNITPGERELIANRIDELREEILYHASREGWQSYIATKKRMGRASKNDVLVGAVRAVVHSTRMIFAKPSA